MWSRLAQQLAQPGDLVDGVAHTTAAVVMATLHCGLPVQIPKAIEDIAAEPSAIVIALVSSRNYPVNTADKRASSALSRSVPVFFGHVMLWHEDTF
jgi:hypothetical protein